MKGPIAGVAVLIVLAACAGYWIAYDESHASQTPVSTTFQYEETGVYSYVAELKNNSLYGPVNLTNPNATLFYGITSWLHVTYVYHITLDRVVNTTVNAEVPVVLESSVWSKPLGAQNATFAATGARGATLAVTYDLNVTSVVSLVSSIVNDTGYQPDAFAVRFSPTVTTSVDTGGTVAPVEFASTLALNFTSQQIVPSALLSSARGAHTILGSPTGGVPGIWGNAYLPIGILVASLGAAGYLGLRPSGGSDRHPRSRLEADLRAYRDEIAETDTPPPRQPSVEVRSWADLVKVADTLGRPILRLADATGGAREGSVFYVLADSVAYVYRIEEADRPGEPTGLRGPSRDAPGPAGSVDIRAAVGEGDRSLGRFVREVSDVSERLRTSGVGGEPRREVDALLLRAIARARQGHLDSAERLLREAAERAGRTDLR